jgi:hypothetical protein
VPAPVPAPGTGAGTGTVLLPWRQPFVRHAISPALFSSSCDIWDGDNNTTTTVDDALPFLVYYGMAYDGYSLKTIFNSRIPNKVR